MLISMYDSKIRTRMITRESDLSVIVVIKHTNVCCVMPSKNMPFFTNFLNLECVSRTFVLPVIKFNAIHLLLNNLSPWLL